MQLLFMQFEVEQFATFACVKWPYLHLNHNRNRTRKVFQLLLKKFIEYQMWSTVLTLLENTNLLCFRGDRKEHSYVY